MNSFVSSFKSLRWLNGSLVLALLVAMWLPAVQPLQAQMRAGVSAVAETNCYVANVGHRTYLPLVGRAGAAADAVVLLAGQQVVVSQQPIERTLTYDVGRQYSYQYDLTVQSQATSLDENGSDNNSGLAIGVEATVEVGITAQDQNGVFSGYLFFSDVTICAATATGAGTLVDDATLLAALADPLLFTQNENGTIVTVSYPVDSPDMAVNIQKGVLNSLQITLMGNLDNYIVEETGGQGSYQAAYAIAEQTDGLAINRTFNQDSFTNLLYTGDENEALILQNTSNIFLDGTLGVLKSVQVVEQIISADQSDTPADADGASASSGAYTRSNLTLAAVGNLPTDMPHRHPETTYVVGGLGAILTDDGTFRPGIDMETVDLTAEFNAFEADPDNPHLAQRLADLMDSAEDNSVRDLIETRLATAAGSDEELAKRYVDVLGINGSPEAQALLLPAVQKVRGAAVQEHALIGLVMLRRYPISQSVALAVRGIATDPNDDMQELALLVLGAIVDNIQVTTGGGVSPSLVKQEFRTGLQNAADDETRILYMDALGNAADLDALALITPYLVNTHEYEVREAAVHALRKLPAADVEATLIGLLSDTTEDPVLREVTANVLRGRVLTPAGALALAAYEAEETPPTWADGFLVPQDINYKKTWGKYLGGSKFGLDLPGSVSATEKSNPNSISLVARQEAVAKAWVFSFNIAMAELISQRKGDKQELKVTFSLLNNKIKKSFDKEVQCQYTKSATLYKATHTLIDFKQKIPVWGIITVDLGIRATGSIGLDYSYNLDVCNPLKPYVQGTITPSASAALEGYAALSIQILRGGASITGTLLNTSMPAIATAQRNNSFSLCFDIKVKTKPLTISVKVFAERIKLNGSWKRFYESTLFSYHTPEKVYPLLVTCLP